MSLCSDARIYSRLYNFEDCKVYFSAINFVFSKFISRQTAVNIPSYIASINLSSWWGVGVSPFLLPLVSCKYIYVWCRICLLPFPSPVILYQYIFRYFHNGRTALHIFRYIISIQNGRTALHIASERGHSSTVQVLLERGAHVDLTDQVCNCAIIVLTQTLFPSLYLCLLLEDRSSCSLAYVPAIYFYPRLLISRT